MKSKVLIILMLSFAILFGQHSKDYQGITAPHYHPGEPGFDQNNCVGYALGRAGGKLAGDHYCDPTEIYATRINNYIFHAFPHTGEIGDYNMLPGDIIVWGSAYLSNPYGKRRTCCLCCECSGKFKFS